MLRITSLFLALALAASATTLRWSWVGTKSSGELMTATGEGQMVFTSGLTEIGISDVLMFDFRVDIYIPPGIGVPNGAVNHSDFTSPNSLDLVLDENNLPISGTLGIGPSDWWRLENGVNFGGTSYALYGPVTWTDPPDAVTAEVSPLAMMLSGIGLIGVFGMRRRGISPVKALA